MSVSINITEGIKRQYLVFEISEEVFALPVDAVAEVLPMVTLVPVPSQPPFVQGFLDWQDGTAPLPVLRLDILLRLNRSTEVPGLHTPILALRGANAFGLLVERVRELVLAVPQASNGEATMQQNSFNGCVSGLLPLAESGKSASLLSVERLLLVEERERLDAFAAMAEERRAILAPAHEGVAHIA